MKPILFHIFGWGVPSYAVLMGLGYVAALAVLLLQVKRATPDEQARGLNRGQVWDLFIVMLVASIVGSKVGHTLFEAPGHVTEDGRTINSLAELLAHDPLHWARIGEAGYVWYGGLIGCLLTAVVYFWRRPHLSGALISDAFAPAIVAGAVPGRLGCFLAGCCHGVPTASAVGVQFPKLPAPVHPTQLYDATIAFVLFATLFAWFPRRKFNGQVISMLLIGYSVLRFFTESFRGDADRGELLGISTSQFLSIPLFLSGVLLWVTLRKKGRESTPPAAADALGPVEPTS